MSELKPGNIVLFVVDRIGEPKEDEYFYDALDGDCIKATCPGVDVERPILTRHEFRSIQTLITWALDKSEGELHARVAYCPETIPAPPTYDRDLFEMTKAVATNPNTPTSDRFEQGDLGGTEAVAGYSQDVIAIAESHIAELAKVNEPAPGIDSLRVPDITVGDRVKVVTGCSHDEGRKGSITGIYGSPPNYIVNFGEGYDTNDFNAHELTHLPPDTGASDVNAQLLVVAKIIVEIVDRFGEIRLVQGQDYVGRLRTAIEAAREKQG